LPDLSSVNGMSTAYADEINANIMYITKYFINNFINCHPGNI
jgi:hypothetical protein